MCNNLDLLLEESEIEPDLAQKQLKILKMLMYSYTNTLIAIDIKRIKKQKDLLLVPSKVSNSIKNLMKFLFHIKNVRKYYFVG